MERSFTRTLDCYTEKHHIIPKCMGGDNKERNLAILTPEEHYVCHQLLVKIYPDNRKLVYSTHMMCVGRNKTTNKMYGWLKRKHSDIQRERMLILSKGEDNNFYGKTHSVESKGKMSTAKRNISDETRLKMSLAKKGKKQLPEHIANASKSRTGKPSPLKGRPSPLRGKIVSPETCQKISDSKKGKPLTPEHKQNILNSAKRGEDHPSFGKPVSPETRQKQSDAKKGNKCHLGKTHSPEARQKMSDSRKGPKHFGFGKRLSPEHIAKREASRKLNRELKLQAQQTIDK